MSMDARKTVDTALIEKLLKHRGVSIDDSPCASLEATAMVLSGNASPEQMEEVSRHLDHCALCRESVLLQCEMTAMGIVSPLTQSKTSRRGLDSIRFERIARLAAAAVLAIVLGVVFVRMLDTSKQDTSSMVTKGSADELFVAVKRGDFEFIMKPGDKLQKGDAVGLFYSSEKPGYAAVFSVDTKGKATLIFPANAATSAKVQAASKARLPDGAVVQDGEGCEWIAAVFSDREFNLRSMKDKVESATVSRTECRLQLRIESARSIRIISFTR